MSLISTGSISLDSTFKAMVPPRTVIAHYALNGQMRSKAHTALTAPLVLHKAVSETLNRIESVNRDRESVATLLFF
jgi:hypothetical protein